MNFKTKKEATSYGNLLLKDLNKGWDLNVIADHSLTGTTYCLELVNKSMFLEVMVEGEGFQFYHGKLDISVFCGSLEEGITKVKNIVSGIIQKYETYLSALSFEENK